MPNFDTPSGPPRREGGVSNIMVLLLALKENVQQRKRATLTSGTVSSMTVFSLEKSYKIERRERMLRSIYMISRTPL